MNRIPPTIESYFLKIEKLLPEESCNRWCISNVVLVPSPAKGETLDSYDKFECLL